jgi:hypothetical protein
MVTGGGGIRESIWCGKRWPLGLERDNCRIDSNGPVVDVNRLVRGCHRAVSAATYVLSLHDFDLEGASAKFSVRRLFLVFPLPRPTIPFPKIFVNLVSR